MEFYEAREMNRLDPLGRARQYRSSCGDAFSVARSATVTRHVTPRIKPPASVNPLPVLILPGAIAHHKLRGLQEGSRRGCQDARELLRYEAVTFEEALHHTLVEVNETQGLLEEGRVQAAARYGREVSRSQKST